MLSSRIYVGLGELSQLEESWNGSWRINPLLMRSKPWLFCTSKFFHYSLDIFSNWILTHTPNSNKERKKDLFFTTKCPSRPFIIEIAREWFHERIFEEDNGTILTMVEGVVNVDKFKLFIYWRAWSSARAISFWISSFRSRSSLKERWMKIAKEVGRSTVDYLEIVVAFVAW